MVSLIKRAVLAALATAMAEIKASCYFHAPSPTDLIRSRKTAIWFFMMTVETNIPEDVTALARAHTNAAIAALVEIVTQADAPASARVSAARTLLDRAWGKVSTQPQENTSRAALETPKLDKAPPVRVRPDHEPEARLARQSVHPLRGRCGRSGKAIPSPAGRSAPRAFGTAFAARRPFCPCPGHGVKPGDRVAVQAEKSATALILYLACLRAGAIYLPLNTGYTPSELAYFVRMPNHACSSAPPENREKIAVALPGVELLTISDDGLDGSLVRSCRCAARLRGCPGRDERPGRYSLYLRHHGAVQGRDAQPWQSSLQRRKLIQAWAFSEADVLLHALPIFHIHGLFVATNVACVGRHHLLLPKFDPDAVFRACPGHRDDGRADFLYPSAEGRAPQSRHDEAYAAVRFGLGAAVGGNPSPMASAHRSCPFGTLWHDRNQYEYFQSLSWRARSRFGRLSFAGHGIADREARASRCRKARSA